MAVIHDTTLVPTKLELLAEWLPRQAWFSGPTDALDRAGGFRLDDPSDAVGIEFMIVTAGDDAAFAVPMTYRGAPVEELAHALIGTTDHGVLGKRWVYDAEHDPVFTAQLAALVRGEVEAQAQTTSHAVDPTVVVGRSAAEAVRVLRRPAEADDAVADGHVSVPWRRPDGSPARGVVAVAG